MYVGISSKARATAANTGMTPTAIPPRGNRGKYGLDEVSTVTRPSASGDSYIVVGERTKSTGEVLT